ncbi:MAG TPA: hypothetical protein EYN67_08700 [Flavobacteriales bacterium]|nr:hypothetical protein [Flavobacteriales bacterium]
MLEWLKSAWARWKVHVSVVGGVLVIATAYGTCSVEPPTVSEATPTFTEPATAGETVPVSSTTETTTETTTGTTTETQ